MSEDLTGQDPNPNAEFHLYDCKEAGYSLCLLNISSVLFEIEENLSIAALILLHTILISDSLIVYNSNPQSFSLLQQFVIFHHLLHYCFNGDVNLMRSVVGSNTELFILSSEKSLKSDEKQIIDNLLKFEDGYTDEIVARNQLREVVTEIFPEKSGIAAANTLNSQDILSFLTSENIKK